VIIVIGKFLDFFLGKLLLLHFFCVFLRPEVLFIF
jgi:hypothetical protein